MSILPRYALPARESARNINVETKPKQVESWLGRLPLSNPVEAAEDCRGCPEFCVNGLWFRGCSSDLRTG